MSEATLPPLEDEDLEQAEETFYRGGSKAGRKLHLDRTDKALAITETNRRQIERFLRETQGLSEFDFEDAFFSTFMRQAKAKAWLRSLTKNGDKAYAILSEQFDAHKREVASRQRAPERNVTPLGLAQTLVETTIGSSQPTTEELCKPVDDTNPSPLSESH